MPKKTIPAVSIIIPMYNVEKYIGECLDSILAQTFQEYEVIVVDDCSTDKSCEVVESYLSIFGDKLRLIRSGKNSGAPGIPKNIGLKYSFGDYILFLDSDDLITKTALDELYSVAKKFDADVVHCERYFQFTDNVKDYTVKGYQTGELVKEPTLITDDFAERVKDLYNRRFIYNLWTKLIRREYIIKNNLQNISAVATDCNFTISLVCSAERYVRVPNVINFYRIVDNSISHIKDDAPKKFQKWLHALVEGFVYLESFLSDREFFQKRPDLKQVALEVWVRECCGYLQGLYAQCSSWQFDELIRHELEGVKDKDALMAFLFSRMNVFNVQLNQSNAVIQQMTQLLGEQNQVILQLQAQLKKLQDE